MLTYTEADTLLSRGRNGSKKLGNNTYLERIGDDVIGVRLHRTYVVRIYRDGRYTLHTGGWRTVTTKQRINKYGPARVSQHTFEWLLRDGSAFVDGMTVNSEGVPL